MYLSSSSLLSFWFSLWWRGFRCNTLYVRLYIACVSLEFLAYNWMCFCRAFAGVSKYCAKNHLPTAKDWQNSSIFTLEYFIAVVIFNLGLNFRRRRAYSFLSGKATAVQNYCIFKNGSNNYLNPNIRFWWRKYKKKILVQT